MLISASFGNVNLNVVQKKEKLKINVASLKLQEKKGAIEEILHISKKKN